MGSDVRAEGGLRGVNGKEFPVRWRSDKKTKVDLK